MKNEKTDRRIKYTKMVLKQGIVNLLKEKPISKITVKEICEEADINRATFYAHYTDQYDLLKQIENDLMADINQYLNNISFHGNESELFQRMYKIFDYINDNSELCSVLLGENGDSEFQKDVMTMLQKQFISEWTKKKGIQTLDAEYIYSFIIIGCIGLVHMWLKDGMKKSAREMAELLIQLTSQGLSSFI